MKFSLTFKTPDVLDEVEQSVADEINERGIEDEDEKEELEHNLTHECNQLAKKFLEYSEYITVEFDTIAGTATVQPA